MSSICKHVQYVYWILRTVFVLVGFVVGRHLSSLPIYVRITAPVSRDRPNASEIIPENEITH